MEPTADELVPDEGTIDVAEAPQVLVEEELLVEEISIDGMCGVY
ncbi:MAG: mycofactocin precursor MftA [Desertimonas sp.]